MCVYIKLNYHAVYLELIQHCIIYTSIKKNKKIGRKLKISPQNKRKCRERYLLESIDYQVSADDLEDSTWFEQVRKLDHK